MEILHLMAAASSSGALNLEGTLRKEGKQELTAGAIERQLEAGDRLRSDASKLSLNMRIREGGLALPVKRLASVPPSCLDWSPVIGRKPVNLLSLLSSLGILLSIGYISVVTMPVQAIFWIEKKERTFPDGGSGTPKLDSRTELAKEARDTESDSLIDSFFAPFLWNSTLEKSSIKWTSWSVFNLSPPDPTTRPAIAPVYWGVGLPSAIAESLNRKKERKAADSLVSAAIKARSMRSSMNVLGGMLENGSIIFLLCIPPRRLFRYGMSLCQGMWWAPEGRRKDEQNYHQKRDRHSTKPKASESFGEAINSECQLIRRGFLITPGVVFAPHLDNRDLALSISKRFSHSISHPTAKLLGVRNWNQTAKHADSNSL
ncbi:hypothetical protein FNV43_RR08288 [Rhamnella rubrinervis]|uniref:Uncharacterized protein n=1 Tax=Rhamnella rubrinervis TaxID=2594499 RepID=A0A8K0HI68_9ROSA|nr:hypothetical protein FNV43_RR08288 [Rhamnella rubrinervis]